MKNKFEYWMLEDIEEAILLLLKHRMQRGGYYSNLTYIAEKHGMEVVKQAEKELLEGNRWHSLGRLTLIDEAIQAQKKKH